MVHFDHTSCTSLSFAELEFKFSIPLQRFINQTLSEGQLISGCESPTERISSFVDYDLLQPIAKVQESYLKNTTDFLNFIEKTKVAKGTMLVSMDVTSLYTNIPQEEGINILCKTYETFQLNKPPIPNLHLRDMLGLILKENSFHVNGKNYLQTHGTAIHRFSPAPEVAWKRGLRAIWRES